MCFVVMCMKFLKGNYMKPISSNKWVLKVENSIFTEILNKQFSFFIQSAPWEMIFILFSSPIYMQDSVVFLFQRNTEFFFISSFMHVFSFGYQEGSYDASNPKLKTHFTVTLKPLLD